MTRRRLLAIVALVLTVSATAMADVTGNWRVQGTIGEFPIDIMCGLKEVDKKLSGLCKDATVGELKVTGQSDGANVSFSYEVNFQGQQMTVSYSGKVESAAEMKGSIAVMGTESGSFTAKKQ